MTLSPLWDSMKKGARRLSDWEELELVKAAKEGDEKATQELLSSNMVEIESAAWKHFRWRNSLGFDDLLQEGTLGFLRAIEKFDPTKKVPFNFYMKKWIWATMNAAIYRRGRTIKTPVTSARDMSKIEELSAKFHSEEGRDPTADELAETLNFSKKRVDRLQRDRVTTFSMDYDQGDDVQSIHEMIADSHPDPYETFVRDDSILSLKEFIEKDDSLSDDEKFAIKAKHALIDGKEWTLKEIGENLGMSIPGARAVLIRSMEKTRRGFVSIHDGV